MFIHWCMLAHVNAHMRALVLMNSLLARLRIAIFMPPSHATRNGERLVFNEHNRAPIG